MRETLGKGGKIFIETQYGKTRLINDVKNLYRQLTED